MPNNTQAFSFFGKEQQEAAAVSKSAGAEVCGYTLINHTWRKSLYRKKMFFKQIFL